MGLDRIRLAGFAALALLAGCATPNIGTDVETTGMPNAEVALRRAIDQANGQMSHLRRLQRGPTDFATNPVMPSELQRVVSFTWTGPLDAGVQKLADSIGYQVAVTAPANSQPLPVTVTLSSTTIVSVFAALGDQAGTRATVQVDPLHRRIEVAHHV